MRLTRRHNLPSRRFQFGLPRRKFSFRYSYSRIPSDNWRAIKARPPLQSMILPSQLGVSASTSRIALPTALSKPFSLWGVECHFAKHCFPAQPSTEWCTLRGKNLLAAIPQLVIGCNSLLEVWQ
jgi:hypothetical protein